MTGQNNKNGLIRWMVILSDFCILNAILFAFHTLMGSTIAGTFDVATKYIIFVANASMFIGESFYATIIHIRKVKFLQVLQRTFMLAFVTTFIFALAIRFSSDQGGLFVFYAYFFIAFYIVLIIARIIELALLRSYRAKGHNRRTVVFVGNDPAVLDMYNELVEDPSAGYFVKGYYADAEIKNAPAEFKRLGTMEDLDMFMNATLNDTINGIPSQIEDCFCCLSHQLSDEIFKIMHFCDKNVIHFYYIPRAFGEYKLHLDPKMFMDRMIYSSHTEPLSSLGNRAIKRAFDIAVSLFACVCMIPLLPIIAIGIKVQSPGPLLFRQSRTGINGNTFQCLKFRSMHVNKDADKVQATKNDPRKFAFGNFMRKTNLDELPQFFNVLKGDMSIVGPRPHMLHHTEIYGTLIDKYMVRHFCKPGITGWAQVTGYRGETKELWQMKERVERDIWYIENWSFWLDIRIIFMTAKSIIFPDKNAY